MTYLRDSFIRDEAILKGMIEVKLREKKMEVDTSGFKFLKKLT